MRGLDDAAGNQRGRADREGRWAALADEHGLLTAAEAGRAGRTSDGLRWAVRSGALHRLRRGVFVLGSAWETADGPLRHRLLVRAAQRATPLRVAVADSAAALLELPLPFGPPSEPRLLTARVDSTPRGAPGLRSATLGRRAWLSEEEVWTLSDGVRVTSAQRTVVDCARHLDRPWSLAVADASRVRWRLSTRNLLDAAARNPFAPGHPAAVWAARHATPLAESPLESLARAAVVLGGHPEPTPQVWISTHRGPYRVDLLDADAGLVVEADGRLKYAGADDLWREKRREDALRDAGFEVVRFTYEDHLRPRPWLARYARARARPTLAGVRPRYRGDPAPSGPESPR